MSKQINPSNSPYLIDISDINTANWANNKQIFEITGKVQVILPSTEKVRSISVEIYLVNVSDDSELNIATTAGDTAAIIAPDHESVGEPKFKVSTLQSGESVQMKGKGGCLRCTAVSQGIWKFS